MSRVHSQRGHQLQRRTGDLAGGIVGQHRAYGEPMNESADDANRREPASLRRWPQSLTGQQRRNESNEHLGGANAQPRQPHRCKQPRDLCQSERGHDAHRAVQAPEQAGHQHEEPVRPRDEHMPRTERGSPCGVTQPIRYSRAFREPPRFIARRDEVFELELRPGREISTT